MMPPEKHSETLLVSMFGEREWGMWLSPDGKVTEGIGLGGSYWQKTKNNQCIKVTPNLFPVLTSVYSFVC